MALQGTFKDFGLADIFQLIGIQRKTGLLTLSRKGEEVTVSFLDGNVVYAETTSRRLEERLGSLFVRSGKITAAQLQEALRIQSTTLQRLGTVLLASRMITPADLREVLQVQMTQIVLKLFRWSDGDYHFSQEETVDHDRETFTPLSAETLLMEGARLMDEWPLIERKIPSFSAVFRRTREGESRLQSARSQGEAVDWSLPGEGGGGGGVATLEAPAKAAVAGSLEHEAVALIRLVDGKNSVQEIIDQTRLGDFDACRILYDLLQRALIEDARAEASPVAIAPPAPSRLGPAIARAMAVVAVAASLAALPWNPLLPWRARGIVTPDAVRMAASRARLSQIDLALKVFYFDKQALPQSLDALVAEGILHPADLNDPWGRPYSYRIDPSGYQVRGGGPDGRPDPSLAAASAFGAAQRLVIEGGLDEKAGRGR